MIATLDRRAEVRKALVLRYQRQGDYAAREELVRGMQGLVKHWASRITSTLPNHVAYDDVLSDCNFVLLYAIERYDASKGVKFENYAYSRMWGAVVDGITERSEGGRAANELERVLSYSKCSYEEARQKTEFSDEKFHNALTAVKLRNAKSLFEPTLDGSSRLIDTVEDKRANVLDEVIANDQAEYLTHQIPKGRLRTIFRLRYLEGQTFRYIAKVLGIDPSRVTQIKGEISEILQSPHIIMSMQ